MFIICCAKMRIILCEKNFVRFIFAALLLPAFLQMTVYSLRASAHADLMCIGWVQLHMVTEIDLNCQKKLCKTYATLLLILIYFLAKHQFFNKANKPSNPNSRNEILFNPCNFLFPPQFDMWGSLCLGFWFSWGLVLVIWCEEKQKGSKRQPTKVRNKC